MIPVVLLALLFVVQFALAYYARQVLAGATQDGAAAAARQGSTTGEGTALTDQLIGEAGGSLLTSHTTNATIATGTITITSTGKVVTLLPFMGGITVRASGTAKVETFEPQGAPP